MKNIKKFLMLMFLAIFALVLVGCTATDEPEPDVEPELPAPTELEIELSIYDGTEKNPYVLVGSKMYLDVVCDDGADDTVTWTVSNDKATIESDDNRGVVTGVKGGSTVVTATSTKAPTLSKSITIEVVETSNFNDALVLAKEEIERKLPTYAYQDFKLPQLENDCVKVSYRSFKNVKWTDGQFPYTSLYDEKVGDTIYAFYVTLEYHGVKLDTQLTIKMVKDAEKNDFVAIEKAKAAIIESMAHVVDKTLEDGSQQKLSEKTKGVYNSAATGKPSIDLHGDFTAEEVGQDVSITVNIADATAPIKVSKNASGSYALAYTKPLADQRVQVDVYVKSGTNNDIVKLFIVAAGYQPEEIVAHFIANKLCPEQAFTMTKSFFNLYAVDTTKKFTKVSVKWSVDNEDVLVYNEASHICKKVSAGECVLTGVFYYGYSERTILVDVLDENGELVKNEDGSVKQEEQIQEVYTWKQEFKFNITVK